MKSCRCNSGAFININFQSEEKKILKLSNILIFDITLYRVYSEHCKKKKYAKYLRTKALCSLRWAARVDNHTWLCWVEKSWNTHIHTWGGWTWTAENKILHEFVIIEEKTHDAWIHGPDVCQQPWQEMRDDTGFFFFADFDLLDLKSSNDCQSWPS